VSPLRAQLNVMIVFLVSGLWHGAAWTFVAWGALHGTYFLVSLWTSSLRARVASLLHLERVPRLHAWMQRIVVFHLVTFAWLFFRARGFRDAWRLLVRAFDVRWSWSELLPRGVTAYELGVGLVGIACLTAMHVWQKGANTADFLHGRSRPLRWGLEYALVAAILLFGQFNLTEFIYFRF